MILNSHLPDPGNPRVMILSCPKTGNIWVRWLLHYAYQLPLVEVPVLWSDEVARTLPPAFVTHQHFWPSPELVQWLEENRVTVVTTMRHPADTLLSYFHFMKWSGSPTDPAKQMLLDGDRPGDKTLEFAMGQFASTYSISLQWARLGAKVVRYESLLDNPVRALRALATEIAPIDDHRANAAALLSTPGHLVATGLDRRHIRTGSSGRWASELRADIVQAMAGMNPYKEACDKYAYDWGTQRSDPPPFDYASIDPFRGKSALDNGEPIGTWMVRIFLLAAENARARWPDPTLTAGDSYWTWLMSPCKDAGPDVPPPSESLPNLLVGLYGLRPDLQKAFPDPRGADRDGLLNWLFRHGVAEHQIGPEVASTIRDRYCPGLVADAEVS